MPKFRLKKRLIDSLGSGSGLTFVDLDYHKFLHVDKTLKKEEILNFITLSR